MTQGTIFTCAVASDYFGRPTEGIILTARCDISNDKARVHNYLPIVRLDDWLHHDGRIILAQRIISDSQGAMRGILKDAGLSPVILDTDHPRKVLETLFPDGSDKKRRERFETACGRFELAERCATSSPTDRLSISLAQAAQKTLEALLSELVHNNLSGFYFLNSVEPGGSDLAARGKNQSLPVT